MSTAVLNRVFVAENVQAAKLLVAKIQRTCVHDGPGVRSTVFFKGCALRCLWCQNPENLTAQLREGDREMTPDELFDELIKDAEFYRATGGGVTFSGGEPLLQDTEALIELLAKLKEHEIPVSLETTLFAPWDKIKALIPYVKLFLVDFKVVGDKECHQKLTGQTDDIIKINVEKLIEQKANVKFRTVIVPGFNDSKEQIIAFANYLKAIDKPSLELLQYFNFYESKAEKLGLTVEKLNISQKDALEALKKAADLFRENGIEVYSDYLQPQVNHAVFTDRVNKIRQDLWEAKREICFETAELKTRYYKKEKGFKKPLAIHRAERLKYVLEHRTLNVWPNELLVGNFTAKRVAGQIWEEQYGVLYVSFLYKAAKQTPVKFFSSAKERRSFYFKVMPYWIPRGIVGRFTRRHGLSRLLNTLAGIAEQKAGFNNNFAAIAHFIVNFDRLLELGTTGLKKEIEEAMVKYPENNQDFYKGALISLEGLERFAERYAEYLTETAASEADAARKKELSDMAEICKNVPKNPAKNFREALQSMTFLQIALCTEAYENAVSFGRLDQVLYPYYERDLKAGIIDYDTAKELLALFVLKMDEAILVNDGDGILNVSKLFETLSTDQALTFGGYKPDGTDGTNDLTYMFCDICELLPLAVNMCARINENSPQKYLKRLAELYIGGCPMPELFADDQYFDALKLHYNESDENCRNYAIVGCVEPNASADHFGNTDSANINVTLPLLQAMKGQEHDLWNFNTKMQIEKFVTRVLEFYHSKDNEHCRKTMAKRKAKIKKRDAKRGMLEYNPAQSMEQLLERYQERLNTLARSVLGDQQRIEAVLKDYFTTPLASTLFKGCIKNGKDAYEGGTEYCTAGIQAVGITDVADGFLAIEELVFNQKKYTMLDMINAIEANYEGYENILEDILALPKFGDNTSERTLYWVNKTLDMYNKALAQCPYAVRGGKYMAGYYALNTSDRYGKYTGATPNGRKAGVPLCNSVTPHYGAPQDDLLSALNDLMKINWVEYAPNGTTVTFTIDAALFPGENGIENLGQIFKTFLTKGGMQFQPNIVSRELLLDAYNNPEKHKYLMVRVAGYCAYFQELSEELKQVIINRTCYA
ncbi:MAG: radical SAM protein [Clostridium sp.]|jgi:formate C-acetyltransferase|nr:radical SAM protein [Clostridium sp.]